MKEPSEPIIGWLQDAHAMEQRVENALKRHIEAARDLAPVRERLREHLEETRAHAARVRQCLASLGCEPSPALSTATTADAPRRKSIAVLPDELVQNALADYAMEHFEIACYTSLLSAAEETGLDDVARTAREILAEEQAMADWLRSQIPQLTRLHLDQTFARPAR